MTEDEMAGWHHQLNGQEFVQILGDGEGQGSLACCSPWGCKESDTTEQLNNNCLYLPGCVLHLELSSAQTSWSLDRDNTVLDGSGGGRGLLRTSRRQ